MYSNRENKRLSIFSISLALLLGASNISLITYLVSTANHKSIPSFDIPVGPYTSYRLTATKNGYTLSYRANDPKKLITRTRTSSPKGLFGGKTEEVDLYEENTLLGKVSSKDGEGIFRISMSAGPGGGRVMGVNDGCCERVVRLELCGAWYSRSRWPRVHGRSRRRGESLANYAWRSLVVLRIVRG